MYCVVVFNPGDEDLNLLVAVAWEAIAGDTEDKDKDKDDSKKNDDDNKNESDILDESASSDPFNNLPTNTAGIRDITPSSSTSLSVTTSWFTFVVVALLITAAVV